MSPNKEDYLKAIFEFSGTAVYIPNKYIAEKLGIAPASVTEMLNKLADEKLIRYFPYKGSQLTARGQKLAEKLSRDHKMWVHFLVEYLSYQPVEAHEIAEKLEHISLQDLPERMEKFVARLEKGPKEAS